MNKEQLKKNVGDLVRLLPIAHRLNGNGYPLPQIDDEWRIESVAADGVQLFLPRTGHGRTLSYDHICDRIPSLTSPIRFVHHKASRLRRSYRRVALLEVQ